jgi:hypothetical protein
MPEFVDVACGYFYRQLEGLGGVGHGSSMALYRRPGILRYELL